MTQHRLAVLLRDAVLRGSHPEDDGLAELCEPWRAGVEGVVAFAGHAVVCLHGPEPAARLDSALARLGPAGYGPGRGGATDARVVVALAGAGRVDSLDLVLGATGTGRAPEHLVDAKGLDHPRAHLAASWRSDTQVLVDRRDPDAALVTRSVGIGGLAEVSIEVAPASRGRGRARDLLGEARGLVAVDDVVLAAVAPGNAASLRAAWSAGFRPVAAVQLWSSGVA